MAPQKSHLIDLGVIEKRSACVSNPPISIVMPTFNRGAILRGSLESALALDEENFEIIVVDDGSTDSTRTELENIRDPRLSVVHLPGNSGANAARNVGISQARAPYVAFLDSDDIYLPGRLRQPLSIFRQHPNIGIVLSAFTTEKGSKRTLLQMPQRIYEGAEIARLAARYVLQPTTSGLTVRKDVLALVGGFDLALRWAEDRDLVMRVARHAKGATIATPLWHKRWQADGISSDRGTYFPALLTFIARHPIYQREELRFRDYLIARHLMALAKGMKFRQLQADYDLALQELSPPPPPLSRLIPKYLSGRRERYRLQRRLLSGKPMTGFGKVQPNLSGP
jgi:glycosyltransferase involved in cell wall biosynthesis